MQKWRLNHLKFKFETTLSSSASQQDEREGRDHNGHLLGFLIVYLHRVKSTFTTLTNKQYTMSWNQDTWDYLNPIQQFFY